MSFWNRCKRDAVTKKKRCYGVSLCHEFTPCHDVTHVMGLSHVKMLRPAMVLAHVMMLSRVMVLAYVMMLPHVRLLVCKKISSLFSETIGKSYLDMFVVLTRLYLFLVP